MTIILALGASIYSGEAFLTGSFRGSGEAYLSSYTIGSGATTFAYSTFFTGAGSSFETIVLIFIRVTSLTADVGFDFAAGLDVLAFTLTGGDFLDYGFLVKIPGIIVTGVGFLSGIFSGSISGCF